VTQLTPNFTSDELACKCGCGFGENAGDYAPGFLDFLQLIREILGRALHPTSGARCTAHNSAVGGVPLSAHTRAAASDLSASNGYDRHSIIVAYVLALLVRAGVLTKADAIAAAAELAAHGGGVGIAKSFIHVDTDVHLPRPSSWGYPPNTHNT
jgi:hypothetical protein